MRAALAVYLSSAVPPLRAARALQLVARPSAPLALENAASRAMGQALSLLPPPLRPGRRGVAAAAKVGKAAIDRPAEEDPDLWWVLGAYRMLLAAMRMRTIRRRVLLGGGQLVLLVSPPPLAAHNLRPCMPWLQDDLRAGQPGAAVRRQPPQRGLHGG